jgi:hypothetical protein
MRSWVPVANQGKKRSNPDINVQIGSISSARISVFSGIWETEAHQIVSQVQKK